MRLRNVSLFLSLMVDDAIVVICGELVPVSAFVGVWLGFIKEERLENGDVGEVRSL